MILTVAAMVMMTIATDRVFASGCRALTAPCSDFSSDNDATGRSSFVGNNPMTAPLGQGSTA